MLILYLNLGYRVNKIELNKAGVVGDTMYFSMSPSLLDVFVTDSFISSCPRTFSLFFLR